MTRFFFISILFTLALNFSHAQNIWPDTSRTIVKTVQYNPGKKVIQAEYGKAIMFFRQRDYLGIKTKKDTIVVTPKYFDDNKITELLKKGKARIIRRSTNSEVYEFNHRLVRSGSMCHRMFEFSDV